MIASASPRTLRTFVVIWLGELVSIIGSGLTSFALGVWIFQQTGQATPFALTVLFSNLPRIILSPLAGMLADRWNRRWLMILSDTGSALVTLATVVLLAAGGLQVWHIYVIALVGSAFAAFQEPAYTASVSMLVPQEHLARASGMIQMGQAAEMLISPLLAGLLFGLVGLSGVILFDFITYFVAVGVLLLVHIPQPEVTSQPGQKPGLWGDIRFGWRYLRARAGLFGLLWYFALVNFLANFAAVLTGPLVLSFGSAEVLGLVQTISGLGMLVGSVVMSAWGGPRWRIAGVIGFIALSGFGLLIAGLRPSAFVVSAGLFLMLFGIPIASGCSQVIFQTKIAPDVQGRVFAMRSMISRSMMPLAFFAAGLLADGVFEPLMRSGGGLAQSVAGMILGVGPGRGVGLMFGISGSLLIVVSALVFSSKRIRRMEQELPDAVVRAAGEVGDASAMPVTPEPVS